MPQETTQRPQRWATFDCYGTLVNWEQGMRQALEAVIPGDVSPLLERYYEVEKTVEAEQPFRCYRDVLAETLRRTAGSMGIALALGAEHVLAETWVLYTSPTPRDPKTTRMPSSA